MLYQDSLTRRDENTQLTPTLAFHFRKIHNKAHSHLSTWGKGNTQLWPALVLHDREGKYPTPTHSSHTVPTKGAGNGTKKPSWSSQFRGTSSQKYYNIITGLVNVPHLTATLCACMPSLFSCVQLWDPMDGSPPGFSVHGILRARILEWAAMTSSRGLPNPGIKPMSLMSPVWVFSQEEFTKL